jgi:hypothetical protein
MSDKKLKQDEVDVKKLIDYVKELNQANEAIQKGGLLPNTSPCPSCGRCPTCGRGGYIQSPQITWTTNTLLQNPTGCGFCGTSACQCSL